MAKVGVGVLGLLLVAACGDDDADGADAAAFDGASPDGVAAPAPAAPPQWVCPDGWREVAGPPPACEPWPETGREACESIHEAHLPGTPGCARVGTECAADGWPSDLPADAPIVYVRRDAATAGTGTRAAPFRDVIDGVAAASAGTTVAIAIGSYDGLVDLPADVTLHGACTDLTLLGTAAPAPSGMGRVTARAPGGGVRNLRIGGSRPGLWIVAGASLDVRDVVLDSTGIGGIIAQGDVAVDGLLVYDTTPAADRTGGRAIHLEGRVTATVRRAVLEMNREVAFFARGAEVDVAIEDVAVVDTQPVLADGTAGVGLGVVDGATASVVRGVFEDGHAVGVDVRGAGASLTARDLVVRRTQPADSVGGNGVFAGDTGAVSIEGALLEANHGSSLAAFLPGASLAARDVVVRDTRPRASDMGGGAGAFANDGPSVTLERAWLEGNHAIGAGAFGGGAHLALTDVSIHGTRPQPDGLGGGGVSAVDATLEATRVEIRGGHLGGVVLNGEPAGATIEDLMVTDVESQPMDGLFGHGLEASAGAAVVAARVNVQGCRGIGASAFDDGSRLDITDFAIRDTRRWACVDTTCEGSAAGIGLVARGGAVSGTRFVIEASALAGVQVAEGGSVELADGDIVGNPIGLNVQDEAVDLDTLTDGVRFVDNERNVDASTLPVPDPVDPRGLGPG